MTAFLAGLGVTGRRLRVIPSGFALAAAFFFVVLCAVLERRHAPELAPDRTLMSAVFGIVLPLLSYGLLERVTQRQRLDDSVQEVARHGGNRRAAVFGVLAGSAVITAGIGAALACVGVVSSRGAYDPALWSDLENSAWIG
ncbi:MAG TPA: hypothetical protein VGJ84_07335, partial [Polyangiaceae bacterium]